MISKHTGEGIDLGKTTKAEYLEALEQANQDDYQFDEKEGEGVEGVAQRLALKAQAPKTRADGKPVGSPEPKPRPLSASMLMFARGVIQGKTYIQAHRDAYPNDTSSNATVTASAYRMSRDPRIVKLIQDAWDETTDVLVEDVVASKRYVMKMLVTHSKEAKQEGTKLKALELLGKAVGLFKPDEVSKADVATPEQLKRDLSVHLRLLDGVKKKA
jgi:hypothetical protein